MTIAFQQTIPILRIFDLQKAKEFYVDFLGMTVDWEHRFEDSLPVYLQISRCGLILHLSEHHCDSCPGSTIFVWMTGIEEFHREISSRHYRYARPGIERTFFDSQSVEIADPFGNRIRFNERLNSNVSPTN